MGLGPARSERLLSALEQLNVATPPEARTPDWIADAIMVVLKREKNLIERFGVRELVLSILKGESDIETRECGSKQYGWGEHCGSAGKGKVRVTCESSGGSFYEEVRDCESCRGSGEVQRLKFRHRAYD